MANFKREIDKITSNDPFEYGGKVTIKGDLKKKVSWKGVPYKSDDKSTTYYAPGDDASDEEKENWNKLVNSILNQ